MCAVWGHGICGIQINTLSIYGIIALTGIVTNDSIVLVDKINRNLRDGMPIFKAVTWCNIAFATDFAHHIHNRIWADAADFSKRAVRRNSSFDGGIGGLRHFVRHVCDVAGGACGYLVINEMRVLYASIGQKGNTDTRIRRAGKELDSPALGM
ncbi:MAG: hypothetical protein R3C26_01945 [Calditrichia bacterium]